MLGHILGTIRPWGNLPRFLEVRETFGRVERYYEKKG
jgi:hypothetical protein